MLFSVVIVAWTAAALPGMVLPADSLATFFFPDGKTKAGTLERMVSDTLVIHICGTNGAIVEKRLYKSTFTKVVLPGGAQLDLSKSTWPSTTADDWADVTPSPPSAPVGGTMKSDGSGAATTYPDSTKAGTSPPNRDSIPLETRAIAHGNADSIRVASEARIAAAQKSSKDIDNLEKMMEALISGAALDTASTIAVLPFTVAPGVEPKVGMMAAEYAVVNLSARRGIKVVERAGFAKMMQELTLSQSDIVQESKALAAGKVLAARYIVLGAVAEDQGKRLVTVRIIETETSAVVSASAASIKVRDMDAFTRDALGEKMVPSAALFRSMVIPGWGQFYVHKPVEGGLCIAACFALLGYSAYTIVSQNVAYNNYLNQNNYMLSDQFKQAVALNGQEYNSAHAKLTRLYNFYSKDYNAMVIACAITGVVWIVNCIDAVIVGNQSKKKLSVYFTSDFSKTAHTEFVMAF
jgi:TolB-like protein/TM2 domain-containing membrane protein YozV